MLFAALSFFLNGTILSNNSIVMLSNVHTGSGALYCLTDRELCCGLSTGGAERGVWWFPNRDPVPEVTTADIYFTRGFSSLLLNRRSSAVGPTGVYTCEIPDARNVLRNVQIGLYNNPSEGEFVMDTLDCPSSEILHHCSTIFYVLQVH
jgi:hypothetical protein